MQRWVKWSQLRDGLASFSSMENRFRNSKKLLRIIQSILDIHKNLYDFHVPVSNPRRNIHVNNKESNNLTKIITNSIFPLVLVLHAISFGGNHYLWYFHREVSQTITELYKELCIITSNNIIYKLIPWAIHARYNKW